MTGVASKIGPTVRFAFFVVGFFLLFFPFFGGAAWLSVEVFGASIVDVDDCSGKGSSSSSAGAADATAGLRGDMPNVTQHNSK